jgi:hypothetical protein
MLATAWRLPGTPLRASAVIAKLVSLSFLVNTLCLWRHDH